MRYSDVENAMHTFVTLAEVQVTLNRDCSNAIFATTDKPIQPLITSLMVPLVLNCYEKQLLDSPQLGFTQQTSLILAILRPISHDDFRIYGLMEN